MSIFREAPQEIHDVIADVIEKYHGDLATANVTVGAVLAEGPRDTEGAKTGPAIKRHGWPVLSRIKVNSLQDRVEGKPDATITLDHDEDGWPSLSEEERIALIDQELTRLSFVNDRDGERLLDDLGHPKLHYRTADWQLEGFEIIAKRHKEASPEVKAAVHLRDNYGQYLWDFAETKPVKEKKTKAEPLLAAQSQAS